MSTTELVEIIPPTARTSDEWAALIKADLGRAVESIVAAGRHLIEAQAELDYGEWLPTLKKVGLSPSTAERYMSIARNRILADSAHAPNLPTSWYTLYQLSRLEPAALEAVIGDGTVTADMGREEALALVRRLSGKSDDDDDAGGRYSGDYERYTPKVYVDAARRVMGRIDLDPASCAEANKTVGATHFFSEDVNGLLQDWGRGITVWMNPPYARDLVKEFCEKLVAQYRAENVTAAICLVRADSTTAWFEELSSAASAICHVRGRINFRHPTKESTSSSPQGSCIFYFGDDPAGFAHEFAEFGRIEDVQGAQRLEAQFTDAASIADTAPDLATKVRTGAMPVDRAQRIIRDRDAEDRRIAQARADAETSGVVATVDIRLGDFRDVLADLTDVDAIICDPPYGREFLPLLGDLALWADKVLAPDGVLAVLFGQTYLPDVYRLLDGGRPYRWTGCYSTPGVSYTSHIRAVQSKWKPLLIYGGGPRFVDVISTDGTDDAAKEHHKWGQDFGAFSTIVERLTTRGQLVVDPFMGSGTTLLSGHMLGRNVVGCDIDETSVATARKRLAIERDDRG